MASRGCLHPADAFCYVRGQFIKTRTRKYSVKACRKMCVAYKAYFGMPVGDQDKSWAPHFTCEYCKKSLEGKVRLAQMFPLSRRGISDLQETAASQTARTILEIQITSSQMRLRR